MIVKAEAAVEALTVLLVLVASGAPAAVEALVVAAAGVATEALAVAVAVNVSVPIFFRIAAIIPSAHSTDFPHLAAISSAVTGISIIINRLLRIEFSSIRSPSKIG
jgi:hypothetical protein